MHKKFGFCYKGLTWFVAVTVIGALLCNDMLRSKQTLASELGLPEPTELLSLTKSYNPVILRGMQIHPEDPFKFDFIIDEGDSNLNDKQLKEQTSKLIRYFLAAVTIPSEDLWVNLSPYESDRVIPEELANTDLGRDMLAQDYVLKQLSSSLTHPDTELGKLYWSKEQKDTFNKIWITPDSAEIYEEGGKVMLGESTLKVMSEADYYAAAQHEDKLVVGADGSQPSEKKYANIISEITKEVNHGKHFLELRQMYNALILAEWFKQKVRNSIYQQVYVDKKKINGIDHNDPQAKEKIYQIYCEAFKKGVYDIVKKEGQEHESIKKRYFSGGVNGQNISTVVSSSIKPLDGFKKIRNKFGVFRNVGIKVVPKVRKVARSIIKHKIVTIVSLIGFIALATVGYKVSFNANNDLGKLSDKEFINYEIRLPSDVDKLLDKIEYWVNTSQKDKILKDIDNSIIMTPYVVLDKAEYLLQDSVGEKILLKAVEADFRINKEKAFDNIEKWRKASFGRDVLFKQLMKYEHAAAFLKNADKVKNELYGYDVISIAWRMNFKAGLEFYELFSDAPWSEKLLDKLLEECVKANEVGLSPYDVWRNIEKLTLIKGQEYMTDILKKTFLAFPVKAARCLYEYHPYGYRPGGYNPIKENDFDKRMMIATLESSSEPILRRILETKKSIIAKNALNYTQEIDVYSFILNGGSLTQEVNKVFMEKYPEKVRSIIKHYRNSVDVDQVALFTVRRINELHDYSDNVRFNVVKYFDPIDLVTLMVAGEAEVFTSTFNGLSNRMLEQMRQQKVSGSELVNNLSKHDFRIFFRLLSVYDRLNDFLDTMSKAEQELFLRDFVRDIDRELNPEFAGMVVADVFSAVSDKNVLAVLQEELLVSYQRVVSEGVNLEAEVVYSLLCGMFGEKANVDKEWFSVMSEKYDLSDIETLSLKRLFDDKGINVQRCYFYDDADGRASFRHFLAEYNNDPRWKVVIEKSYVRIESVMGKRILIYVNKPGASKADEDIKKDQDSRNVMPQVYIHGGHSYHASKTIENIPSTAELVILRSCGGYTEINSILDINPQAQIISTKGTGTMFVNDPLMKMLNEQIRIGEDIDWQIFWHQAEKRLGGIPDFQHYVSPADNLGAMFMQAYKKQLTPKVNTEKEYRFGIELMPRTIGTELNSLDSDYSNAFLLASNSQSLQNYGGLDLSNVGIRSAMESVDFIKSDLNHDINIESLDGLDFEIVTISDKEDMVKGF